MKHVFPGRILKFSEILYFMKIRSFESTLFCGIDRQTDSKKAGKHEETYCRFLRTRIALGNAAVKIKPNEGKRCVNLRRGDCE